MPGIEKLESIFSAALEKPPADRAAFLDRVCDGDPGLKASVERLLAEHAASTHGLLDTGPAPANEETTPKFIGSFEVFSLLGEGGMGRVYEAQQESPRRAVALKVIREGLGSREGQRRFVREGQLLAQLKHPGIAQVYAAGVASDDRGMERRFLAMELVRGKTLLHHARAEDLSLAQRIELLARVCEAVQHAHQQGVIHRDLKPANILVEKLTGDAVGQPKVLDFGVARLHSEGTTNHSQATEAGRIIGTLAYMSPEQVEGNQQQIDTRTDVYALGVLGYELLGGVLPIRVEEKSLAEAARMIRDEEPRRLGETAAACRGDVETIIAKAMEKDRERRYSGAGEMAADLRRFLRHEPITARPPTAVYQLRKLARRNRPLVAGAGLALVALVAGLVVSTVQYARASHAAQRAEQVSGFLKKMIGGINPKVAQARDTSLLKEIVDSTARDIGDSLRGQMAVEAELRTVLGEAYFSIGEYDLAQAQYRVALGLNERAHGRRSAEAAGTLVKLADSLSYSETGPEAIAMSREAVSILRETLGEESVEFSDALCGLGECLRQTDMPAALEAQRRSVETATKAAGPDSMLVARMLEHVGGLLILSQRFDEAEKILTRSHAIYTRHVGPDAFETVDIGGRIGDALVGQARYAEAAPYCRIYAEKMAKFMPPTHASVPLAWAALAQVLHRQGNLGEAIELYRAQIEPLNKAVGGDDLNVGTLHGNLGAVLLDAGDFAAAQTEYTEALRIYRASGGPESVLEPFAVLGLAHVKWGQGDSAGAEPLARSAYQMTVKRLPPGHRKTCECALRLAACQAELAFAAARGAGAADPRDTQSRLDEAVALCDQAVKDLTASMGPDHFSVWAAKERRAAVAGLMASTPNAAATEKEAAERGLLEIVKAIESKPDLGALPARELVLIDATNWLARVYEAWEATAPGSRREQLERVSRKHQELVVALAAERERAMTKR